MKRSIAALTIILLAGIASAQTEFLNKLQNNDRPVRVPIRSADPWFIKMMLEGTPVTQSEYSTIQGVRGISGGMGGGFGGGAQGGGQSGFGGGQSNGFGGGAAGGGGSFGGGQQGGNGGPGLGGVTGGGANGAGQSRGLLPPGWYVVVNPTDNSIWLYPERIKR